MKVTVPRLKEAAEELSLLSHAVYASRRSYKRLCGGYIESDDLNEYKFLEDAYGSLAGYLLDVAAASEAVDDEWLLNTARLHLNRLEGFSVREIEHLAPGVLSVLTDIVNGEAAKHYTRFHSKSSDYKPYP